MPKNSPEILSLSTDAQAVLAGYWMSARAKLTPQNQKSRLSARGEKAIQELIAAKIIRDEKADDGYPESRTYSLTAKGQKLEYRKPFSWMGEHGKFSITDPIKPESN